jgi:hypothetical protein
VDGGKKECFVSTCHDNHQTHAYQHRVGTFPLPSHTPLPTPSLYFHSQLSPPPLHPAMHPQPHFSTGQGTERVERWAAEVRVCQLPTPTTPTLVPQPPKPVPHPPSTKPFTSDHCFLKRNPRQPSEEVPAARPISHCRFPFTSPLTLPSPPGSDSSTVHPAPAPAAVCSPRPSLLLCALTCCVCLAGLCSTPRVLHSHAHLTTRCCLGLLAAWNQAPRTVHGRADKNALRNATEAHLNFVVGHTERNGSGPQGGHTACRAERGS